MRALQVLAVAMVCAFVATTGARAAPSRPSTALEAVQAMTSQALLVTSASYVLQPTSGVTGAAPTVAISSDFVLGMPSHGSSYAILSSGNAVSDMQYTGGPQVDGVYTNAAGTDAHGYVAGDINDLTVLEATVAVPSGDNCLSFDFRFLSQEYPAFVGDFNDGLIVQLDNSAWSSVSATGGFTAPGNFAFDPSGQPLSINSTGSLGMSLAGAAGTGFASVGGLSDGGGTDLLTARTPVTTGSHDIYFSVFDQGDHSLDTGALIDNLNSSFVPGGCSAGAVTPPPPPLAPVIVTQPSASPSDSGVFTFAPASGDTHAATYECSVDGGAFVSCASGDDLDLGLLDGAHTLSVRADNSAGQAGPSTGPASWTIARVPPNSPTVTSAPLTSTTSTTADVDFTGGTAATFTCKLDDAAYVACTSPASFTALTLGAHTLLIRQTDTESNTSAAATVTWTIVAAIPQAPQITARPSATPSDTGIFSFAPASGDTSVASYACSIDGGAFAACASGVDLDPGLLDGTHTLAVHALDVSAQSGPDTGPVSWVIARTPPSAPTVTGTPLASSPATTANISFSGLPGATFACSLDMAAFATCTSPTSFTTLAVGSHQLRVRQTDLYGHTSDAAAIDWDVTAVPTALVVVPEVPVATPPILVKPPIVKRHSKTFLVEVRYRIPAGCAGTCRATATLVALLAGKGTRTLGVRTRVALPRGTWARFTITVDRAALLASPGRVVHGLRRSRTRLSVVVTRRTGTRLRTSHEGHISVSVARLDSGSVPAVASSRAG